MATNPLEYFEEQLRDYFDDAEFWDTDEMIEAVPADEVADSIIDSMLSNDYDVLNYFAGIPPWFELEDIFSGTVSIRDIAAGAVSEYCKNESDYLDELIENGF